MAALPKQKPLKNNTAMLAAAVRGLSSSSSVRRYLPLAALAALTLWLLFPYFEAGDPPGVDAPTFLHFGWAFQQGLTRGDVPLLSDKWWYGGFPYLQAYSPLGYGMTGFLAAFTPMDIGTAFKLTVATSLIATVAITFLLARELRLRHWFAWLAAALVLLSYPVIGGIGVYGWLPTAVSLPFGLMAVLLLERAIRTGSGRTATVAGALMGVALLAHHMTAIALSMAILARLVALAFSRSPESKWRFRPALLFATGTVAVSVWWAAPFLANTISVGFEREIPGNWQFSFLTYLSSAFDRGLIGVETYPSYMGVVHLTLGAGAGIYAVVYRTRMRGFAAMAAVLLWFSMGAAGNPLVRLYPFSGFDVSRFSYFLAPFLAVLTAYGAQTVHNRLSIARPKLRPLLGVVVVGLLLLPLADAVAARSTLESVEEPPYLTEATDWMAAYLPSDSKVLAVGFRNWDGFWIPERTDLPIMDGWYDEGAQNWRQVREYRLMAWLGQIDAERLHEIMASQDTAYLVIAEWDGTDSPLLFDDAVRDRSDLFAVEQELIGITVFRALPQNG